MATPPYVPPVPQPARKSNALLWILLGVGGFVLLIVLMMVAGGLFFMNKIRQAGVDPDLIRKNPALAMTKIMAAANPNIEVISVDERSHRLSVRDKKTGKTFSVDMEDAKNGRWVLKEDGKDSVTIHAAPDGDKSAVEISSADGTVKIGSGAKIPAWLPEYPGAQATGTFSTQGKDGSSGNYSFKTKDAPDKVARFYEEAFQSSGLKVTKNFTSTNGRTAGGMVAAEDESKQHSALVALGGDNGETAVNVTYTAKK